MISIIIVHYHVKKEIFNCIESIIASKPKLKYEIIVVDNDEIKTLNKELKRKFPKVVYIANHNKGFGQGNNVGSIVAKGEHLFFLNPDTKIYPLTLDSLDSYLRKNKNAAVVAPLLYDKKDNLYKQGANELTPLSAVFAFSFIEKLFPNNIIAKKYWMIEEWDRKSIKEVASVPGTAFMVRREVFEKIHGFDEKFFLYFEEHDLCKRIRELNWKIFMSPHAKVFHSLGASTKKSPNISTIFQQSRFYYLKKHFGIVKALFAESILRISKYSIMLLGILILNFAITLYKVDELMVFIGDQAWFYLSARDILINGIIPIVGIASSHPWLHQGAFWTYLLAFALAIGQFHPLSGAYLSIAIGLVTIWLMYYVTTRMFSRRVGLIASLLYATSPLIIYYTRMPYHTTPIPLFTLLYIFALYKWVQGKTIFLPIVILILAILYNFQISTFLLTISFLVIASYGFLKKKTWFMQSLTPKLLLFSVLAYLLPMIPMLLYDLGHGFPQTVLFLVWIGYKIATVVGYPQLHPDIGSTSIKNVLEFIAESYKRLIYIHNHFVAFAIAIASSFFLIKSIFDRIRSKNHNIAEYVVGIVTCVSILGIFAIRVTSEAYLPILFPTIILITALFFDKLIKTKPKMSFVVILIVGVIAFANVVTLIKENYFISNSGGLSTQIILSKEIVRKAEGREYNLKGEGLGSQFESFTMNFEYLTWWLGNAPSRDTKELQYIINARPDRTSVLQIGK